MHEMNNLYNKRLQFLLGNTADMALKRRAWLIVTELGIKKGDKILDVGCGDGYYCHLVSSLKIPVSVTGTDFDEAGLKSAKKNLSGRNIKLVKGDLMKRLPFASNSFNKIVMSEVAEHLPNDVKGLKEVYRVLKPGGTLCLTVPNANYPFLWDPTNRFLEDFFGKHIKSGFWAGIWNQHIRLYKPDQIEKSVKKAGFKVDKVRAVTWWCIPFNHNLINLVARYLYGGKLSSKITEAVSKYKTKKTTRPLLIDIGFRLLNTIDSLNNVFQPRESGVAVFVKAFKSL